MACRPITTAIEPICAREGLWLLSDAAQSFGAAYKGRKVGTIGMATATSFFPAKPLGCYGDGGAVFTDDDELADVMRSLRVHGQGTDKYDNVRIGINGRLDTIQAAILIEKLKIFPDEIAARDRVAERYNELPAADGDRPGGAARSAPRCGRNIPLRVRGFDRDAFAERSQGGRHADGGLLPEAAAPADGVQSLTRSPATGCLSPSGSPSEVVSLPMHPYLTEEVQDRIVRAVRDALVRQRRVAAE